MASTTPTYTRERRAEKATQGKCSTCGCRPVAEGVNLLGEPYKSCEECLLRGRKEYASSRIDGFCVNCQAHDFHRADCPTQRRK